MFKSNHTFHPPAPFQPPPPPPRHTRRYQYAALGWLDNRVVSPFHAWVVEFVPRWVAPNLLTLLSLAHGVAGCCALLYHCPTLTESAPNWVYLFYAWCIFMYQTLDGIAGKQARRTGSATPLGQVCVCAPV